MKQFDKVKFRIALADAGFTHASNATIFNDRRTTGSRMKLWMGASVTEAPMEHKVRFVSELQKQFGDRLVSVGPYPNYRTYSNTSVVVKIKD